MKLRTAIKIMRYEEEPWRYRRLGPRYSIGQIRKAWKLCERKWRDRRVPYLPNADELQMRCDIFDQLLLGGPLFGEGILEGLVPPEMLEEARQAMQNL
jgi:hypothetical protein